MNETNARVWLLQYWYQLRNAFPMLSQIGSPVREEDGPAYLFSTLFVAHRIHSDFARRFALVPWMTYRSHFEALPGGFTTDCGWGCMLRSAQMMLAETLMRKECANGSSVASPAVRERVLRLFFDRSDCPYGIHTMAKMAARYGKVPGEWFEPTLTLLVVRDMLAAREKEDGLRAIVARDGLLDVSSIVSNVANAVQKEEELDPLLHPPKPAATSVLLLIPLRLGLRELNEQSYGDALIRALRFPQSVGMIGGKPAHSLYFCGSQGRKVVFLDPHTVQSAESASDLRTFQCPEARCMPIGDIDPSLALGFLISSYDDFLDLKMRLEALPGPALFSISLTPVDYDLAHGDFSMDEDDAESVISAKDTNQSPVVLQKGEDEEEEEFEQIKAPSSPLPRAGSDNLNTTLNGAQTSMSASAPGKKPDEFVFL